MRAIRWALAILIAFHGLIHVMGSLAAWGIGNVQAQVGTPIVALSGFWQYAFGCLWLAACMGLLATAVLLALDREAWVLAVLISVSLSQLAIAFWWTSAWRGTLANLIILAAIAWQVTARARSNAASSSNRKRATAM